MDRQSQVITIFQLGADFTYTIGSIGISISIGMWLQCTRDGRKKVQMKGLGSIANIYTAGTNRNDAMEDGELESFKL